MTGLLPGVTVVGWPRVVATLSGMCLLAASVSASAQSVDEIVERHIAARGGRAALLAIGSVRMSGRMQMGPDGDEAAFVLEMKRPNRMRMDLTIDGVLGSQAFDGTRGWAHMPFAGLDAPEAMPAEIAAEAKAQADFDGPLLDYRAKGHHVSLVGRERHDDQDVLRLRVTPRTGSGRDILISTTSWLEVGSESTRQMQGMAVVTETRQGGSRKVGGVTFPTFIQTGVKGTPQVQRLVIDDIRVNVPVDDARFVMPGR